MTIDDRGRQSGQAIRAEVDPLEAPDLSLIESRRRLVRTTAAFAGAAAIVLAAVGVVGMLRAIDPVEPIGSSIAPTTTTVISTTTAPETTSPTATQPEAAAPEPTVVIGANGWSFIAALESRSNYQDYPIRAVVTGEDRIVAAGIDAPALAGRADARPAIWTSTDGRTWSKVDSSHVPGTGGITDIAWGSSGLVAVGHSDQDAVVWSSTDGLSWDRNIVPSPENGFARMDAVIAVDNGYFAAGHELFIPTEEQRGGRSPEWVAEDWDAAVWFSADGRSWQRIEDPTFGARGYQENDNGEFNSRIIGIADAGWGIVFAGYRSASDPNTDYPDETTAVWVLRDEWERVDLGTEDQLLGVAAADGIAVVHGSTRASPSADAIFYVSTDGAGWQQAGGDLTGVGAHDGLQFVHDVAAIPGGGWLAVGTDEKDLSTIGGAAAWTAPPGVPLTWTRVEHDDAIFGELASNPLGTMLDIAFSNDTAIIVGGQALMVDLGASGSMCCEYAPSAWLWQPGRP